MRKYNYIRIIAILIFLLPMTFVAKKAYSAIISPDEHNTALIIDDTRGRHLYLYYSNCCDCGLCVSMYPGLVYRTLVDDQIVAHLSEDDFFYYQEAINLVENCPCLCYTIDN